MDSRSSRLAPTPPRAADLPQLPACLKAAPRPLLPTALLCAHLLDRALYERPAGVSDAPAWFEATAALIRECLKVRQGGAAE